MAKAELTGIETTAEAAEAAEADALPRAAVVHSDPDALASAEQKPLPKALSRRKVADKSAAEWAYERVIL